MSTERPFSPDQESNQVLSADNTVKTTTIRKEAGQVRVVNNGGGKAYVRTYNVAAAVGQPNLATPSTKSHPVPSGMSSVITKPIDHDGLAYTCPGSTATLDVETGEGW